METQGFSVAEKGEQSYCRSTLVDVFVGLSNEESVEIELDTSRSHTLMSVPSEQSPLGNGSFESSHTNESPRTFLNCYYTNATSLNNQMNSLNALAATDDYDIIAKIGMLHIVCE
jgi:hypothetical protein